MDVGVFLLARYEEDDGILYDRNTALCHKGEPTQDMFRLLVRARDNTAVARGIVRTWQNTPECPERGVLWLIVLMLTQPFEGHPDFDPAWLAELAARLITAR